jgi:hypothetical protein
LLWVGPRTAKVPSLRSLISEAAIIRQSLGRGLQLVWPLATSFRTSIFAASGSLFTIFVQLYIQTSRGNSPETTLLANLTYLISGINLSAHKSLKRWPNRQRLAPPLRPPRNGFSAAEAGRAQDISIGFLQFEFGPWQTTYDSSQQDVQVRELEWRSCPLVLNFILEQTPVPRKVGEGGLLRRPRRGSRVITSSDTSLGSTGGQTARVKSDAGLRCWLGGTLGPSTCDVPLQPVKPPWLGSFEGTLEGLGSLVL